MISEHLGKPLDHCKWNQSQFMSVVIVPILNARSTNLQVSQTVGILPPDATTLSHRKHIVALAAKHALPAVYQFWEFVEASGFLCYGTNIVDVNRRGVSPLRTALETPSMAFNVVRCRQEVRF